MSFRLHPSQGFFICFISFAYMEINQLESTNTYTNTVKTVKETLGCKLPGTYTGIIELIISYLPQFPECPTCHHYIYIHYPTFVCTNCQTLFCGRCVFDRVCAYCDWCNECCGLHTTDDIFETFV